MSSSEAFKAELKEFIVTTLVLEDISPEEIGDDQILFGEGLGLDSIDALELAVAIEKEFGVRMEDSEETRHHFTCINNLAQFITESKQVPKDGTSG